MTSGNTFSHLELFSAYLVELNAAETMRKEAVTGGHTFHPEYDHASAKRDFFAALGTRAGVDTFKQLCGPPHRLQGSLFGDEFMLLLHR